MNEIADRILQHHIAATYDLGDWTAAPSAVTGGLKHRLCRVRTGRGEYAVKVLSPQLLREPEHLARYGQAEQIAQAAARAGLPAVCALLDLGEWSAAASSAREALGDTWTAAGPPDAAVFVAFLQGYRSAVPWTLPPCGTPPWLCWTSG